LRARGNASSSPLLRRSSSHPQHTRRRCRSRRKPAETSPSAAQTRARHAGGRAAAPARSNGLPVPPLFVRSSSEIRRADSCSDRRSGRRVLLLAGLRSRGRRRPACVPPRAHSRRRTFDIPSRSNDGPPEPLPAGRHCGGIRAGALSSRWAPRPLRADPWPSPSRLMHTVPSEVPDGGIARPQPR